MRALVQKDVVRLLRSEVNRAGGQTKWAKQNGIVPSAISMVLAGDRPPNKKIISALKLRRVIVFERVDDRGAQGGLGNRKTGHSRIQKGPQWVKRGQYPAACPCWVRPGACPRAWPSCGICSPATRATTRHFGWSHGCTIDPREFPQFGCVGGPKRPLRSASHRWARQQSIHPP